MRALSLQRTGLERLLAQSAEERRAAAVERRELALRRRDELLKQLRQRTRDHAGNNEEQSTLREGYARRWAAVYSELALRREKFTCVLSCSTVAADRSFFSDAVDSWATYASAAQRAIAMLVRTERVTAFALSSRLLQNQMEQVAKVHMQVKSVLARERCHRRLLQNDTAELFKDQERLLAWCVEQREILDSLGSLTDLREFCASFMSNVAVMDTNFLVLLERGERLVSNKAVRMALVDVNRAWMELSVAVYQRTCQAIHEAHVASGAEAACRWWVDAFVPRLKHIFAEARAVASDKTVGSEPQMTAIHERGAALLKSLCDSQILVQHISNFTVRGDCLAPYEESLRSALLMPLSLFTQTFLGNAKYGAQREYADEFCEISDWIDAQVPSSTHTQLMRRVEKMRVLVEEQLRLLPSGNCDVTVNT